MTLHQNKALFDQAIVAAAQFFNIQEIYIEKDYWITVGLYQIFHSEIRSEVVFKGGTALSKAHRLIERFSEDIDLVILKKEQETGNQLRKKLRAISAAVEKVMPEVELEGITNKKGMIRKTAHSYNKGNFNGTYGQVREYIILESTWLGNFEPYVARTIDSYVSAMMEATGRQDLIGEYTMKPFEVRVLGMERTVCEKIMSLVRFSQTNDPIRDLRNKIRHIYDLHKTLQNGAVNDFFISPAFDDLLMQVATEDIVSFRNNNSWLVNHPKDTLLFTRTRETWDQILPAYQGAFRELVLGDLPDTTNILNTLNMIAERLSTIQWKIDPKTSGGA